MLLARVHAALIDQYGTCLCGAPRGAEPRRRNADLDGQRCALDSTHDDRYRHAIARSPASLRTTTLMEAPMDQAILPMSQSAARAPGGFPVLKIQSVTHTYSNGIRALADVTLTVPCGMYGLLGPNGAGKSTLMRILATLLEPSAGRVFFDGVDVIAQPMRLRRVLGYSPQEFGVYPKVSAENLLDHLAVLKGIGLAKARREQVRALLAQVNLFDSRNRAVSTFSG